MPNTPGKGPKTGVYREFGIGHEIFFIKRKGPPYVIEVKGGAHHGQIRVKTAGLNYS